MTEKENNKPALGSQSYGVGGHGVAEPKGSDRGDVFLDEVFDNRQPDRETFEDDVVSD